VALSRARLGLYVFCRLNIFENCYEINPSISQLLSISTGNSKTSTEAAKLRLVANEGYPSSRANSNTDIENFVVDNVNSMGLLVYQMIQQIN
jgi:intron-binding protein aquarius